MTDPQLMPDVEAFITACFFNCSCHAQIRTLAAQFKSVIDAQASQLEGLRKAMKEVVDALTSREAEIERLRGMVLSPEVLAFLHGSGELEGCSFGEKPTYERGNYWWRKYLPQGTPELVYDKATRTIVPQPSQQAGCKCSHCDGTGATPALVLARSIARIATVTATRKEPAMSDDKLVPSPEQLREWMLMAAPTINTGDGVMIVAAKVSICVAEQAALWGAQQQRAKDASIADAHFSIEGIAQDIAWEIRNQGCNHD